MAHGYLLSSFLARLEPAHGRVRRLPGEPLRFPLEIFDAVRAVWPATSRSRCGSRRPTGPWAASSGTTPSRSPNGSRSTVATSWTSRPDRRLRMHGPPTAAATRRRSRTRSDTRSASPRSRSVRSRATTTSTASFSLDELISARWRGLISTTRPGRCTAQPSRSTRATASRGRSSTERARGSPGRSARPRRRAEPVRGAGAGAS